MDRQPHGVDPSGEPGEQRQPPAVDNFCGAAATSGTLGRMSFEDLPADWATRPLTDETIFTDVIDLVVTVRDRVAGAAYVLLCGPTDRLLQPCAISDFDQAAPDRRALIEPFARIVASSVDDGGIVLAVARDGRAGVTDSDRLWHEAAIEVCRRHGIRLVAVAVATPRGVWRLPDFPADEAQPA